MIFVNLITKEGPIFVSMCSVCVTITLDKFKEKGEKEKKTFRTILSWKLVTKRKYINNGYTTCNNNKSRSKGKSKRKEN